MNDQNERAAIPGAAVACLSLAAFGSGISLRVNDALLPRLAQEFGIGLGQAAQVISFFAIAYGLAQLLRGMLFAVAPADPVVFLAVPLALMLTAAAATAIPALRASRIDPMAALRAN